MSLQSFNSSAGKPLLCEYIRSIIEGMKENGASKGVMSPWTNTLVHLTRYSKKDIPIETLTPKWIEKFRLYLTKVESHKDVVSKVGDQPVKPLSEDTIDHYIGILKRVSSKAFNEGLIENDVAADVPRLKKSKKRKSCEYLTVEELRRLASTPCIDPSLKNAFMFSALTGIRKKDIMAIEWDDVKEVEGMTRIMLHQKSEDDQEYVDINDQAVRFLTSREVNPEKPFARFVDSSRTNQELKRWAMSAEINKYVTFKMARDTFAAIMLSIGTDIVLLASIMGVKEIRSLENFKEEIAH